MPLSILAKLIPPGGVDVVDKRSGLLSVSVFFTSVRFVTVRMFINYMKINSYYFLACCVLYSSRSANTDCTNNLTF